jgi:hypothetical protein
MYMMRITDASKNKPQLMPMLITDLPFRLNPVTDVHSLALLAQNFHIL